MSKLTWKIIVALVAFAIGIAATTLWIRAQPVVSPLQNSLEVKDDFGWKKSLDCLTPVVG